MVIKMILCLSIAFNLLLLIAILRRSLVKNFKATIMMFCLLLRKGMELP